MIIGQIESNHFKLKEIQIILDLNYFEFVSFGFSALKLFKFESLNSFDHWESLFQGEGMLGLWFLIFGMEHVGC